MPCWYFEHEDLKNTPSIQDGMDYGTECQYRKAGARLIIDIGFQMNLNYNTVATGVVYFHRFYMLQSFKQFPKYVTACCCLYLAGKVEETPKRCRDILDTVRSLLPPHEIKIFGKDSKQEILTLEKVLLQTIKFDLEVEHPYSYLLEYVKSLKGDKLTLEKMVQMAWTFINDSLCTTLSLLWEQEIIAIAVIHLASKLNKFEIVDWKGRQPEQSRWWDMFVEDLSLNQIEEICRQILDSVFIDK
ncbi:cyclin-K-like [Chelonus insularis]|uniref:cyclin-K-like n=1 Tax=Chelonus insularis TaxID=460826 RepID=UPI00158E9468|nr:cyclin-K-like [Chelonus insularis]